MVFDRYEKQLRAFQLTATRYEAISLTDQRLSFAEIQLGLGVWPGNYRGTEGLWLRWYDVDGNWLPLPSEQAQQVRQEAELSKQQAEQERQRAERLAAQLRQLGMEPETL